MNDQACGIESRHEGEEPSHDEWRAQCRLLWAENVRLREEVQTAFDKGYRAAGGTITPITELLHWLPSSSSDEVAAPPNIPLNK